MAKTTKATTKATTVKKTPKKQTKVTNKTTSKKKAVSSTSASQPFLQARFTDQTVYWIIFGAAAITFALWLYTLDSRVRDLYDQIDANTYSTDAMIYKKDSEVKVDPAVPSDEVQPTSE